MTDMYRIDIDTLVDWEGERAEQYPPEAFVPEWIIRVEPDTEAIIDILLAMLDEYDYRGRNIDFDEYAGRIVATWKDSE